MRIQPIDPQQEEISRLVGLSREELAVETIIDQYSVFLGLLQVNATYYFFVRHCHVGKDVVSEGVLTLPGIYEEIVKKTFTISRKPVLSLTQFFNFVHFHHPLRTVRSMVNGQTPKQNIICLRERVNNCRRELSQLWEEKDLLDKKAIELLEKEKEKDRSIITYLDSFLIPVLAISPTTYTRILEA